MFLENKIIPDLYICDNEDLVKALNTESPLKPLTPEWDIIEPTRQFVQLHRIKCEHVRGHQDKHVEYEDLHPIAKLNF